MTRTRGEVDEANSVLFLGVTAAAIGLLSLVVAVQQPLRQPNVVSAFFVLIVIGECVRVTLQGDVDAAPLGAAGSIAFALVYRYGHDGPTTFGAATVIAGTTVATFIGLVPHLVAGRAPAISSVSRRVIVTAALAIAFRPAFLPKAGHLTAKELTALFVVLVVFAQLLDLALGAVIDIARNRSAIGPALRNQIHGQGSMAVAVGSTGVLMALTAARLGPWALLIFAGPLLLVQFAFRRYSFIKRTYQQTIRSLSRMTEVAGLTETGHASRVSDLAVAVGRELRMNEQDLEALEYAALMHDLGQLSLPHSVYNGATVLAPLAEQQEIARLGAEIIRQTAVLDTVATFVEAQANPYRSRAGDAVEPPLGSRIIKAVNAYDDVVGDTRDSVARLRALEQLQMGIAYDYDPRVVDALDKVLSRSAQG